MPVAYLTQQQQIEIFVLLSKTKNSGQPDKMQMLCKLVCVCVLLKLMCKDTSSLEATIIEQHQNTKCARYNI